MQKICVKCALPSRELDIVKESIEAGKQVLNIPSINMHLEFMWAVCVAFTIKAQKPLSPNLISEHTLISITTKYVNLKLGTNTNQVIILITVG